MTYRAVLTQDWTPEQFAPYTKDVTAAFRKLADKFPQDMTVESLGWQAVMGARQLWLVLDDDEKFVTFFMTEVQTIDATGKTIAMLTSLAGDEGQACAETIFEACHKWAQDIGADIEAVHGRRGWAKALKHYGFHEYAVLYRRDIAA